MASMDSIASDDEDPIGVTCTGDLEGEALFQQRQTDEEYRRLGSMTPLKTILFLAIGPLLSELCQGLYGLMDSFWISRTIGEDGLTVMSLVSIIDFVSISFSMYFAVATSSRISYLFGRGRRDITSQVLVDLIRYCIIFGVVLPIILLPCAKPLLRFYGGDEKHVNMGFHFLCVACCFLWVDFIFLTLCGALQAMGQTVLFGGCQVAFALLNVLIWDPVFLAAFRSGVWGSGIATIISQAIPTSFIAFRLFRGHFFIKPTFSQFLQPFNKQSGKALRVALPQLVANLMTTLPSLLLMKLVGQAGNNSGGATGYENAMASWNVVQRVYVVVTSICLALSQSFLPAGSFALGRGNIERLRQLAIWALVFGIAWCIFGCIVIEAGAEALARLFGDGWGYVEVATKMFRYSFATIWAYQPEVLIAAVLQSMKLVKLGLITAICMFIIPVPVFAGICYALDRNSPAKLMLSYVARDMWALVTVVVMSLWRFRFFFAGKESREEWMRQQEARETEKEMRMEPRDETGRLTAATTSVLLPEDVV